jgi:hypothetical protein
VALVLERYHDFGPKLAHEKLLGCDHEWFETRGGRCTLLVYVDDATGKLMEVRFVRTESAFDYFDATTSYVKRYGRPLAFYSGKHSIFRVKPRGH